MKERDLFSQQHRRVEGPPPVVSRPAGQGGGEQGGRHEGGLQAGEEGEDVVTRWEAQMGVLHTVHSYKHQAAAATVTCHLDTYTDITAAPSVCDDYIKVACC